MFVLITVTAGGRVSSSRYETLYACQQARSVALYGKTMEDKEASDRARAEAEKRHREMWYAAHPPREPRDEHEKAWIKAGGLSWGGTGGSGHVTSDGLIQDDPQSSCFFGPSYSPNKGEWVDYSAGFPVVKHAGDIKTAICVAETPETAAGLDLNPQSAALSLHTLG